MVSPLCLPPLAGATSFPIKFLQTSSSPKSQVRIAHQYDDAPGLSVGFKPPFPPLFFWFGFLLGSHCNTDPELGPAGFHPSFVEIFNPEDFPVNLEGWILRRYDGDNSSADVRLVYMTGRGGGKVVVDDFWPARLLVGAADSRYSPGGHYSHFERIRHRQRYVRGFIRHGS